MTILSLAVGSAQEICSVATALLQNRRHKHTLDSRNESYFRLFCLGISHRAHLVFQVGMEFKQHQWASHTRTNDS